MALTKAQTEALEKLPLRFDYEDPKTVDGVQWRTVEALVREGLAEANPEHSSRGEHHWEVTELNPSAEQR